MKIYFYIAINFAFNQFLIFEAISTSSSPVSKKVLTIWAFFLQFIPQKILKKYSILLKHGMTVISYNLKQTPYEN